MDEVGDLRSAVRNIGSVVAAAVLDINTLTTKLVAATAVPVIDPAEIESLAQQLNASATTLNTAINPPAAPAAPADPAT